MRRQAAHAEGNGVREAAGSRRDGNLDGRLLAGLDGRRSGRTSNGVAVDREIHAARCRSAPWTWVRDRYRSGARATDVARRNGGGNLRRANECGGLRLRRAADGKIYHGSGDEVRPIDGECECGTTRRMILAGGSSAGDGRNRIVDRERDRVRRATARTWVRHRNVRRASRSEIRRRDGDHNLRGADRRRRERRIRAKGYRGAGNKVRAVNGDRE